MTHDPLCPFFYDHTGRELVRQTGNPCTYCKLIANVREDERAAALNAAREVVATFEPLLDIEKREGGYDCCGCDTTYRLYEDALAAIEGLREGAK